MVVLNVENSKTTKFWRMSVCTNSDESMLFANALCPLLFTKSGSNISDTRKSVYNEPSTALTSTYNLDTLDFYPLGPYIAPGRHGRLGLPFKHVQSFVT